MGFKIFRTGSKLCCIVFTNNKFPDFSSKTYYLIISAKFKKTVNNINIRYKNAIIDNIDKATYLGIVIDNQLTFESHINNL